MNMTFLLNSSNPPFGMVMPGRNWQATTAAGYGFGFNGKMKNDEIKGNSNSYDFGDRIYDGRLGRWYSVDKLAIKYKSNSPYIFAVNNPITQIDFDGNKVLNFYTAMLKSAEKNIIPLEAELDSYACIYGSLKRKKDFTGTKADWKYIKGIEKQYKAEISHINDLKVKERIVNEIISDWQTQSPDKFNEFDKATNHLGEQVDMYIKVDNLFDSQPNQVPQNALAGYNEAPRVEIDENNAVRPTGVRGVNTITITLEIDESDRANFENKYGQDIENHEGGHFLYFIKHAAEYMKYIEELKQTKREFNGGHNEDDESGKNAKKYGDKN